MTVQPDKRCASIQIFAAATAEEFNPCGNTSYNVLLYTKKSGLSQVSKRSQSRLMLIHEKNVSSWKSMIDGLGRTGYLIKHLIC